MASIYRPKGSKKWRIAYRDATGRRRTIGGYRDKEATKAKAKALERDAQRIHAGLPVNTGKTMAEAIPEYIWELKRRGSDPEGTHVTETQRILLAWQTECDIGQLRAIHPDVVIKRLQTLHERDKAPRTVNRHHETLRAFLNFCVDRRWIEENPIAGLKLAKVGQAGKRHRRRAFTAEELPRLFAVAGPRAVLYQTAAFSGLRRKELAQLTKRDLIPTGNNPHWRLREEITKSKRSELLPMTPECAESVGPLWAGLQESRDLLFPVVPAPSTFRRDLKTAGIPRLNSQGKVLDFHSFRYTFCSLAARILPIQKVMVLMRHKSITLTANLYLDLGLTDIASENWTLPPLFQPVENSDMPRSKWRTRPQDPAVAT